MNRPPRTVEAAVRAFRDETAAPADGRATRARVLAALSSRAWQRRRPHRRWVLLVAVLAASSAAWAGYGALRTLRDARTVPHKPLAASGTAVRVRATRAIVPAVRPAPAPRPMSAETSPQRPARSSARDEMDAALAAYARAHAWHFDHRDWPRSLRAWNDYLRDFPRSTFEPEARFNRALCLMRLGRQSAALEALRPFAEGAFGTYRRAEAQRLVAWLMKQAD
jgi:hypothetical protein